jgi:hypothetical protein
MHEHLRRAGTLLEVWTRLLSQLEGGVRSVEAPSAVAAAAIHAAAAAVFTELLQAQLAEYEAGASAECQDDWEVRTPSHCLGYCLCRSVCCAEFCCCFFPISQMCRGPCPHAVQPAHRTSGK